MASVFETEFKNAIYQGFKGRLLTGTFRKAVLGAVDANGDHALTYTVYSCEGIVDPYSAYYKKKYDIPETDTGILIIAGSLSVTPTKQDQVKFRSTWYQIRGVKSDPAEATWVLQAFAIADPTL
jgi:uncharacterized alpha/beta hydrolase family protein